MNHFENSLGANRYSLARPYIHETALSKFLVFSSSELPIPYALDAGCGTGQSSAALAGIADRVLAIDVSAEMLAVCKPHPRIEYRQSPAENIPADDRSFDLITVALAFHWFDQAAFIKEAHRVLEDHSWVVIYSCWFTGEMKEDAGFANWFKAEYLSRYPTPPRNLTPISDERFRKFGLFLRGEDTFEAVRMTVPRFTDYELSTTNVLAATNGNATLFGDAESWISRSIQPFFENYSERTFLFAGRIWYLQRDEG